MKNYNIYIPTISGEKVINCNEIVYAESFNTISKIFFKNTESLEVLLSVSELEYLFSERGFFRFNNRNLVNLKYVQVIFPLDASKVILENGKEIIVSKNRKDGLFKSLKEVFDLEEAIVY